VLICQIGFATTGRTGNQYIVMLMDPLETEQVGKLTALKSRGF
jgi:hypothetical protein